MRVGGEDWEEDGWCVVGGVELIDLHSMVLWGNYEVDLHDACIPLDYNLIALGSRVCWPCAAVFLRIVGNLVRHRIVRRTT